MKLVPWLAAAGSGVALALALPGLAWFPLLLLFPPLLLEAVNRAGSWRSALGLGWLAGSVHWLVAVTWVVPVMHDYGGLHLIAAVLCLIVMAGLLGLSWAATAWLTRIAPTPLQVWLMPAAWCAIEASRQLPPYAFPWNTTATAVAGQPWALASLPVWGATGLAWALTMAGSGLWGVARPAARRSGALAVTAAAGLVALLSALAPQPAPHGEPLTLAVLQPDTALEEKWDPAFRAEIVERVWRLTEQAADAGAEVVLWPESAVPMTLEGDPTYRAQLVDLARGRELTLVLNSLASTASGGYTNSAFVVSPSGVSPVRYDKVRLVPFGEYVPALFRIAFTESLVREVPSFTAGRAVRTLPARAELGMSICYEIVFADLVTAQVRQGATVLGTITNDGWYGFSWAPEQHLAHAMLRAAENRRWVVRAALTGISALVNPRGEVVQRLELGESGFLVADVQPCVGLTPRARWGDWWGFVCGLASAAIIAWARVRVRRMRTRRPR